MTSRAYTSMALAVVLMVLSAHWGVRFGMTVVSGATLILLRYFLLPRVSEEGVEPVRRALNIGLSVLLWVSFLLLPTTDWVPQDVFLPGAVMAGMWFLLDQSKGRLLDTLYAGLVALVAVVGIALTPAQGVLALPGALLVGALLLLSFGQLDLERVREELRATPPSASRVVREWPLLIVFGVVALMIPRPTLDRDETSRRVRLDGDAATAMTGFSRTLRLGAFGKLKSSDTEVMRVRFDDTSTGERWTHEDGERSDRPLLLLRGMNLDRFDGRGFVPVSAPIRAPKLNPLAMRRLRIRQEVSVMDYTGTELFALAPVVSSNGAHQDGAGGVRRMVGPIEPGLRYVAVSEILDPKGLPALEGFAARHPDGRFTALPLLDSRISELALELVGDAASDYARTQRIATFLTTGGGFRYTRIDPNRGRDPLAQFLFENRAGHCEYYAAGMVVLLRCASIPCRVAIGFRGGTYSDQSQAYRVLAKNAHAWVEVFFEQIGWVTFDPTPAESLLDVAADPSLVEPLLGETNAPSDKASEDGTFEGYSGLAKTALTLLFVIFVGGGLGLLWRHVVGGRKRVKPPMATRDQRSLRERVNRVLHQAGSPDQKSNTLLERLEHSRVVLAGDAERVRVIIEGLYRWRFGGVPFTPLERSDALRSLSEVEGTLTEKGLR